MIHNSPLFTTLALLLLLLLLTSELEDVATAAASSFLPVVEEGLEVAGGVDQPFCRYGDEQSDDVDVAVDDAPPLLHAPKLRCCCCLPKHRACDCCDDFESWWWSRMPSSSMNAIMSFSSGVLRKIQFCSLLSVFASAGILIVKGINGYYLRFFERRIFNVMILFIVMSRRRQFACRRMKCTRNAR